MLHDQVKSDIEIILQQVTGAGSPQDELALLRASLRCYLEGMTPGDAVAWAAKELSKSISQ
jgi:hypothetical protein